MLISDEFDTNPLSRADGSALWTTGSPLPLSPCPICGSNYEGQTKVLVSINGPIEVPRRDELVSETTIDIQFRPVSGFSGDFNI